MERLYRDSERSGDSKLAEGKGKIGLALGLAALALAASGLAFVVFGNGSRETARYATAGLEPMNADEVSEQFFLVAPEMLTRVYLAFNETEETAIYDSLAEVAAGDALEALYLERVGAMADNGLDASAEADQQIHTMEMLRISTQRDGQSFTWDARWRVVGTVGHATHLHVRGNIYAAILDIAPVEGAWRITGFELTDVDRTEAGQMVAAEP
ncbi:MAG: hypothetical protein AAF689_16895 [Pseudomonadota bacterium]